VSYGGLCKNYSIFRLKRKRTNCRLGGECSILLSYGRILRIQLSAYVGSGSDTGEKYELWKLRQGCSQGFTHSGRRPGNGTKSAFCSPYFTPIEALCQENSREYRQVLQSRILEFSQGCSQKLFTFPQSFPQNGDVRCGKPAQTA